ncbi:PhoX family phosphatase [Ciceribacter sp. L1K23]|uniref:PhoX family protein n=1 Tax=Ciceribacter sp. L1K23 TaxID=2820276 RepID=UPI001B811A78|nr:PhoX family phosphatase [Ciceribacter sp. L1K23]MBR0554653.1 PhoX family phosphatase [Ciceribacter sp. L1K23]
MSDRQKTRARPNPRRQIAESYCSILNEGIRRRSVLKGLVAGLGGVALAPLLSSQPAAAAAAGSLSFKELERVRDDRDHWPEGYDRQVLIRWGDALFPDSPAFDLATLDGKAAERQFGYNNDFTYFMPLPHGAATADNGLMIVSHEYASPFLMFPGLTDEDYRDTLTDDQIRAIMASVGLSIFEVRRTDGKWAVVLDSSYNRRIHMGTDMAISGPAAGDDRLKTKADPTGRAVFGTISNCNGGITPWGTMLSGEEGAMDVFAGDYTVLPNQELVERQGWDEEDNDIYAAGRLESRLRFEDEPNEWMRFDWVVEIDPLDPSAKPVKRTALGRFTHEGAQCAVAPDGRVVVFMGDDDDFEYLYRFVTRDPWNPTDRAANRDLLDEGTLSVAKFESDGTMRWLPLIAGEGPLTAEAGFASQADVVLNTRAAADLLGATPMDAPEGFVVHPQTGKLYVAMTENEDRLAAGEGDEAEQVNAANPRGPNPHGHLLELVPPDVGDKPDYAAETFRWDVFVLCGDPAVAEDGAMFHASTTANGWFTDPDNLAVDPAGRLWVATDGPPPEGIADALYVMETEGEGRALPKLFYIPPVGSECCSPTFTPDGTSVFISIQHPGELRMDDNEDATSIADIGTLWPDFADGMPARPSLIVLSRNDQAVVGS